MEPPILARSALLMELDRGPGFGLDLIERIRLRCGVSLKEGSVYPALAYTRFVASEAAGTAAAWADYKARNDPPERPAVLPRPYDPDDDPEVGALIEAHARESEGRDAAS